MTGIFVQIERQDIPKAYREAVLNNPLLARIEATGRSIGWTDEEIRTYQLLAAVQSNASMSARIKELQSTIAVFPNGIAKG